MAEILDEYPVPMARDCARELSDQLRRQMPGLYREVNSLFDRFLREERSWPPPDPGFDGDEVDSEELEGETDERGCTR